MNITSALDTLLQRLDDGQVGVLVRVAEVRGSTPRETDAWMAVWPESITGTIGGGNLEFQAMAAARAMLAGQDNAPAQGEVRKYPLGPALGQCCGGMVFLSFERIAAADRARLHSELLARLTPVAIFGSGHVGIAIVRLLATLPFAVRWIDSRDKVFPTDLPATVQTEYSDPMHEAVPDLAPGSLVLIMSFSHWEDLDIVRDCLQRIRKHGDLPYLGMIGSKTKWAMFRHRLQARGFGDDDFAHMTTPIGIDGLYSKAPEVIAVSVAAQLLQQALPPPPEEKARVRLAQNHDHPA